MAHLDFKITSWRRVFVPDDKIEETIKELQKEVNRCMEAGKDQRAQQVIQKIAELRSKHQMIEASKKPIEEKEQK